MELDSSIIFDIFRLIIKNDNQTVEHQYMFIYDKYFWSNLLNNTDNNKLLHEFINILHYNYYNFIKLIKKIDKKINIIDDIIQIILLSNCDDNKLDDFFNDLWFIYK